MRIIAQKLSPLNGNNFIKLSDRYDAGQEAENR